jgi:hypothetical protein
MSSEQVHLPLKRVACVFFLLVLATMWLLLIAGNRLLTFDVINVPAMQFVSDGTDAKQQGMGVLHCP